MSFCDLLHVARGDGADAGASASPTIGGLVSVRPRCHRRRRVVARGEHALVRELDDRPTLARPLAIRGVILGLNSSRGACRAPSSADPSAARVATSAPSSRARSAGFRGRGGVPHGGGRHGKAERRSGCAWAAASIAKPSSA